MKLLSVDEARARMMAKATPMAHEAVLLTSALGRVLAQPILAQRDQPPFDASAMDGWAVRGDGAAAQIIGESAAGHGFSAVLSEGQTVRIFTGAPIPEGADRVVIQENAQRQGEAVAFSPLPPPGANIRSRGGDFSAGQVLLEPGKRLDPWRISLIAAAGIAAPLVSKAPRVAILSTGEEIVEAGTEPGPHAIFNSGGPALAALIQSWGGEARRLPSAGDDLGAIEQAARGADCDVLVTIGGASVGEHDRVKPALERLGLSYEVLSVRMRPGKPTWFGVLEDGRRVMGLPGNRASALVCAQLFLKPLLEAMQGADPSLPLITARLASPLAANGLREHWMRADLEMKDGALIATPMLDQDSSLVTVFAKANALLRRQPEAPACHAGDLVEILLLPRL